MHPSPPKPQNPKTPKPRGVVVEIKKIEIKMGNCCGVKQTGKGGGRSVLNPEGSDKYRNMSIFRAQSFLEQKHGAENMEKF